jgi:hypothetical protein
MTSPFLRIVTACVLLAGVARAQNVVVGVNVVNPMRASVADQNAVLEQLQAEHVHAIGNNKSGSVVTTAGTLDDPLGSGGPADVSIAANPDPSVNPMPWGTR